MPRYRCYGLAISSSLPLPELEDDPDHTGVLADITVVEGPVEDPTHCAVEVLPGLWTLGSSTWLDVPGVARFSIEDGATVRVAREPDVPDGDVRLFLLGTAIGAAMWQRGHLVLHGNGFRTGGSAAVVVGHSGAGKSTIAGELVRRGVDVLSDDVVPIDADGCALPGYPRIKLWDHALGSLGLVADAFERITASHDKFSVPVPRGAFGPLPARFVYVLETHDRPTLDLQEVRGLDRFDVLRTHTYRRELAADRVAAQQHLRRCADLASRARIVRLLRPAATMTAQASVDAILADIDVHTPSLTRAAGR